MADRISPQQRSANMAKIRGRDTTPEKIVRTLLSGIGVRYRLHVGHLPGRPDIVIRKQHKIIDVRGCFWHQHERCQLAYMPKSRKGFWRNKFRRNVERDFENEQKLKELGYNVLVICECETDDIVVLLRRLKAFMRRTSARNRAAVRS